MTHRTRSCAPAVLLACVAVAALAGPSLAEPVLSVNGQNVDSTKLYDYMVQRYGYASLIKLLVAEVLDQAATKAGVTVTDAEVAAEIAQRRDEFNRTSIETGVDFDSMLISRGQTVEMYRAGQRSLLQMRKMVADEAVVTNEDVAKYYESHPDDFRLKEAMKVSYIRLAIPENPEDLQRVIDQAGEIRQAIVRGVRSFEDAAREYSTDEYTKAAAGKLDRWLTRGQTPFLKEAFGLLQDGDLTDVVGFPGLGLYIIRRDAYARDYKLEYDEVKSELRNVLENELSTRLVAARQRELLKAAEVDWLLEWPAGSFRPANLNPGDAVQP